MERRVAIIGFGEAGRAFAHCGDRRVAVSAYDRVCDDTMQQAARVAGVALAPSAGAALAGVVAVFVLVTADQALPAAQTYASSLSADALWLDMNSVAPNTKRAAAQAIEDAGGRYVDVAVMSPVHPARLDAPLLVSGPHSRDAIALLRAYGFTRVRHVPGDVGSASAIKMIRSVMVKGIEALTAECLLAAAAAGVRQEVLASLDASERPRPWAERADYNLDRMLVHGLRRAAEMEEVVKTLDGLGTGSVMSRGTVARQHGLGALALTAPPEGLDAKLAALVPPTLEKAA